VTFNVDSLGIGIGMWCACAWRTLRQTAYGAEMTLCIPSVNSSSPFDMLVAFYPVFVTIVSTVATNIHVWARAPSTKVVGQQPCDTSARINQRRAGCCCPHWIA